VDAEMSETWYFCVDCENYFTDTKQLKECMKFKHKIKRRTPPEMRMVYHASKIGEPTTITLDIDNDVWTVSVKLVCFKTDEEGETQHLSNFNLDPPIQNMVNRLNHSFPSLHITETQLTEMLETAIKRGVYDETGKRNQAIIYLSLDSWLKLEPRNHKSRLVYFNISKLKSLIKSPEETLREITKKYS